VRHSRAREFERELDRAFAGIRESLGQLFLRLDLDV